jgi:hypothetical protein
MSATEPMLKKFETNIKERLEKTKEMLKNLLQEKHPLEPESSQIDDVHEEE